MRIKRVLFLCEYYIMLRHFLEYEKIEQDITESKIEGMTGIEGDTGKDPSVEGTYSTFFMNFMWMILFYAFYLFLFFVGGSMLLKYCIMLRTSILPVDLNYRNENYVGGVTHPARYNNFFGNNILKLKSEFYPTEFFEIEYNGEKIHFPLYMSYTKYYDESLVRMNGEFQVFSLADDANPETSDDHYRLNNVNGYYGFMLVEYFNALTTNVYIMLNRNMRIVARW